MRHWLQQSDWLPTLEATLALDEESVRRVGDDTVGGPAVSRQLRIIRVLMRDLLIGVCLTCFTLHTHKHTCIQIVCPIAFEAYHLLFESKWTCKVSNVYLPQVNYLHSHGLAHTELRLENLHISPLDRHLKVSTLPILSC